MFAIYSCYWGTFYWVSLDTRSMAYVDYATSAYFLGLIVTYLIIGCGLIDSIQARYNEMNGQLSKEAPGIAKVKYILII